jgi:single-strand DNA-binding protein
VSRGEKTQWYNVVAFDKLAGIADRFLQKGKPVFIVGTMSTRTYEKDGETKYVTELLANEIQLISTGGRPQEEEEGSRDQFSEMPF